ncbi:MAG: methyltransferase domain-containing protein [Pseudomonadota bacterium]
MKSDEVGSDYVYFPDSESSAHDYLLPVVTRLLQQNQQRDARAGRLFEWGCGNAYCAARLQAAGFDVTGIDLSATGVQVANAKHPLLKIKQGSVYDSQVATYGTFPAVLSMEVVEHLLAPRKLVANMFEMLAPGGIAIVTTPFHGYWKNLALALTGRMDAHFTALWDGGHVKFWSMATLDTLLREAGFVDIRFERVGRIPPLAKSMIAIAYKPA